MGDYNVEDHLINNNEGVNDQVIEEGEILKVKRNTLTETQFVVECLYKGQKVQVIASRDEIIKMNISALLDYYENDLSVKDKSFP